MLSRMLDQHRLAILSPRRIGGQVAIQTAPASGQVRAPPSAAKNFRRSMWLAM